MKYLFVSMSLLGFAVSAAGVASFVGGKNMTIQRRDMAVSSVRPFIDTQEWNKSETATFALGRFWGPDSQFGSIYPDMKSFLNSTAVTRVNGYLGENGKCDALRKEIEGFRLSPRAREKLISVVCGRKASLACPVR